jgi:hypothetical protein
MHLRISPGSSDKIPIQYFEIGAFLTSAFLVTLAGLPRFAASRFSYEAIAFRCWGVFACACYTLTFRLQLSERTMNGTDNLI